MSARATASLSSQRTFVLLAVFTSTGLIGLLAIVLGAQIPEYWKASAEGGWHLFRDPHWWLATAVLIGFGVPAYFCLKMADRCADELLNCFFRLR